MVLDYTNDSSSSTGHYRLIYKSDVPYTKALVHGLNVDGKKLTVPVSSPVQFSRRRRPSTTFSFNNSVTNNNVTRPRSSKLPGFIQYAAERERNWSNILNVGGFQETQSQIGSSLEPKSKKSKNLKNSVKSNKISIPLCHPIVS